MLGPSGALVAHVESESVREINALVEDEPSKKMLAASSAGLLSFNTNLGTTEHLSTADGLLSNSIMQVTQLNDANRHLERSMLVLATSKGLSLGVQGKFRGVTTVQGLPSNSLYTVLSHGGKLYVGTLGGLAVLQDGRVYRVFKDTNSKLTHNWVTALCAVGPRVFLGTYGGGVFELTASGELRPFLPEIGRAVVNPNAMWSDGSRLYVGTLDGAVVVDLNSQQWIRLGSEMPARTVLSITGDEKYVYFGTTAGIARIGHRIVGRPPWNPETLETGITWSQEKMRRNRRWIVRIVLGVGILLPLVAVARLISAQSGVLIPSTGDKPDPNTLSLNVMNVDVLIDNQHARVKVLQIFDNHTAQALEGKYLFALPPTASISDFAVWDADVRIPGVMMEKRRANKVYGEIKQQRVDPGLLQQDDEHGGQSAFSAKVVPIPAYGTKRVEMEYTEMLPVESLVSHFTFPLKPSFGDPQRIDEFNLHLHVISDYPITPIAQPNQQFTLTVTKSEPNEFEADIRARGVELRRISLSTTASMFLRARFHLLPIARPKQSPATTCAILSSPHTTRLDISRPAQSSISKRTRKRNNHEMSCCYWIHRFRCMARNSNEPLKLLTISSIHCRRRTILR